MLAAEALPKSQQPGCIKKLCRERDRGITKSRRRAPGPGRIGRQLGRRGVVNLHVRGVSGKDRRLSERVAIGEQLEALLGERRGGDRKSEEYQKPKNWTLNAGQKTENLAANKAGFGNEETYRQAKAVVEQATPELVRAKKAEVGKSHGQFFALR